MRHARLALLVVAGAACEKSGPVPGPGSGSGSAIVAPRPKPAPVDAAVVVDAAPPPDAEHLVIVEPPEIGKKPCFPREFGGELASLRMLESTAMICMTSEVNPQTTDEHCIEIDTRTGAAAAARTVLADALVSRASADGRHLVDIADATHLVVSATDAAHTRVARIELPTAGGTIEPPMFVGNTIYVAISADSPLRARGYLYKPTGEQLAVLPADANVLFGEPVEYADGRWAVPTFGGDAILRFDGTTGAVIPTPVDPTAGKPFSLCADCGWHAKTPSASSMLAPTDGGGLVEVSDDGRVRVFDASGKRTKTFPLPLCRD